jgi:hypothetical protein
LSTFVWYLFGYVSAVVSRIYHSVVVKFTEECNEVTAVSAIILRKSLHVTESNGRHQPKQNDEEYSPIRVFFSFCNSLIDRLCMYLWSWYVFVFMLYQVWKCIRFCLQTWSISISLCHRSDLQTRTLCMKRAWVHVSHTIKLHSSHLNVLIIIRYQNWN